MSKIPIYFMPGLAASSAIFESIKLPVDQFETHFLEWFVPENNPTIEEYAKKMCSFVKHENAVLIGVSFGGILVQEMANYSNFRKIIIISSVKCNQEMPLRMRFVKATKLYKLLPTFWLQDIETVSKFAFGKTVKSRLSMYKKFLTMNDSVYLKWAIEQVLCWKRTKIDQRVIHIHGQKDKVFPAKNIKNYIEIKDGTHIMIINRFKWMNENLSKIIFED